MARFGLAPLGRLLAWQFGVAAAAAVVVVWFLATAYVPVLLGAIERLPNTGAIRDGHLEWTNAVPARLAENAFAAIVVTGDSEANPGQVADLQLEFGREALKVRSIFGFVAFSYPSGWTMALNHAELAPWWGAWRPAVYVGIALFVIVALFASWWSLAFLYAFPARLIALYWDTAANLWRCWKLCGAALMPGAILFTTVIALYGLQQLTLPSLLAFTPIHLVVGWVYAAFSPFCLPSDAVEDEETEDKAENPFDKAPASGRAEKPAPNPFRSGKKGG